MNINTDGEDQITNYEGVQAIKPAAQKGLIGGVILSRYKVVSHERLRELIPSLKYGAFYQLFIRIDQERGKVQCRTAAKEFTDYPLCC